MPPPPSARPPSSPPSSSRLAKGHLPHLEAIAQRCLPGWRPGASSGDQHFPGIVSFLRRGGITPCLLPRPPSRGSRGTEGRPDPRDSHSAGALGAAGRSPLSFLLTLNMQINQNGFLGAAASSSSAPSLHAFHFLCVRLVWEEAGEGEKGRRGRGERQDGKALGSLARAHRPAR